MRATILDGRTLAQELKNALRADTAAFIEHQGAPPHLAVVHVHGDAASESYARSIRKLCNELGIAFSLESLPADVSQDTLNAAIKRLSDDVGVHGILIQLPLPRSLSFDRAVLNLDYRKDVDGIHPFNAGLLAHGRPVLLPNTPAGGMALLQRYGIPLAGRRAAMVGRSAIVGHPMAVLLMNARATVTVCDEYTVDLAGVVRECEIVVVAVGQPGLITGDMLRPGAVVVDFGINVLPDGKIVGDVDFASAIEVASAITPVPGGTGPVTNVILMRNVIAAAQRQIGTL